MNAGVNNLDDKSGSSSSTITGGQVLKDKNIKTLNNVPESMANSSITESTYLASTISFADNDPAVEYIQDSLTRKAFRDSLPVPSNLSTKMMEALLQGIPPSRHREESPLTSSKKKLAPTKRTSKENRQLAIRHDEEPDGGFKIESVNSNTSPEK